MKFFAFIMACLILIMSCTPCQDAPISMKVDKSQTTTALAAGHDHQEAGDECSPLCTCACCSAHSNPQSFIIVVVNTPEISLDHSSIYNGSLISFSAPVWQPPQLLA